MKRPIESDYVSLTAYTRALEEYCDKLAQTEQQELSNLERHEMNVKKFLGVPQPKEQEPVACANGCKGFFKYAPPQRKPLTDEELLNIYVNTNGLEFYKAFARAIEAAHGIKE